jgi:hypothetical protein
MQKIISSVFSLFSRETTQAPLKVPVPVVPQPVVLSEDEKRKIAYAESMARMAVLQYEKNDSTKEEESLRFISSAILEDQAQDHDENLLAKQLQRQSVQEEKRKRIEEKRAALKPRCQKVYKKNTEDKKKGDRCQKEVEPGQDLCSVHQREKNQELQNKKFEKQHDLINARLTQLSAKAAELAPPKVPIQKVPTKRSHDDSDDDEPDNSVAGDGLIIYVDDVVSAPSMKRFKTKSN